MDGERLETSWAELRGTVEGELARWRRTHPRATFAELEQVTREAASRLQAQYLEDLVATSPAADWRTAAPEEWSEPQLPDQ